MNSDQINNNYNNYISKDNTPPSASTNDTPSSIKIIRKGREEVKKSERPKSFIGK